MHSIIRSERANKSPTKKTFLYITNNLSQAELALLSIVGSEFDYLVYINNTQKEYNLLTDYDLPENAKITSDFKSVIMLTTIFSAVITTVGHISPVLNAKIISIMKACVAAELPIIEVPHGLYQWGFNFVDDSKFVNTASHSLGGGYPVPSFADFQLSWFEEGGVGYPRNRVEKIKRTEVIVVPEYTVITTNTNWYMYNFNDQRVLAQSIFEYAKAHPDQMFVWCHHSAELNGMNLINNMYGARPTNIFRYGHDKDIYFHGIDTTEEVIEHAKSGISTISTCLVDYEIHRIPTAIFANEGLAKIQQSISPASFFESPETLRALDFKIPFTGKLESYDVSRFDLSLKEFLQTGPSSNTAKRIFMTL
ncbi:hypothetical protein ABDX87_10430 [Pseudomonas abietaniphila]|uniref:hypothetical protein n=1 Tax=Pseudomonas abietaniphila TaxID=89065 RepID=UPI00321679B3